MISSEELHSLVACLSSVLSELESSVLSLYLDGHSYEAIAERLDCDTKTVDNALQRVKRKVGAHLSLARRCCSRDETSRAARAPAAAQPLEGRPTHEGCGSAPLSCSPLTALAALLRGPDGARVAAPGRTRRPRTVDPPRPRSRRPPPDAAPPAGAEAGRRLALVRRAAWPVSGRARAARAIGARSAPTTEFGSPQRARRGRDAAATGSAW